MEIGRTMLSEDEFNEVWNNIQRELYVLYMEGDCSALRIYDGIYIVCTSTISYEENLYWKIGDFIYNRCKEYKEIIVGCDDYLRKYSEVFESYVRINEAMNKVCGFLNRCVDVRTIGELGYLLWERAVIQELPATFFEDVYNYNIVEDPNDLGSKDCNCISDYNISCNSNYIHTDNSACIYTNIGNNSHRIEKISHNEEINMSNSEHVNGKIGLKTETNHHNNIERLKNTSDINSVNILNDSINIKNLSDLYKNWFVNNKLVFEKLLPRCANSEKIKKDLIRKRKFKTNSRDEKIRLMIINSFSMIRPDSSDPMIYYKEKYERLALNKILEMYSKIGHGFTIEEYGIMVRWIVDIERIRFGSYFLPVSYESLENTLEKCVFYDEENLVNQLKEKIAILCDLKIASKNNVIGNKINNANKFNSNGNNIVNVTDVEKHIVDEKAIEAIVSLLEKPRAYGSIEFREIHPAMKIIYNFSVLNKGYLIAKRAYAYFVLEAINGNTETFSASIEDIHLLYNKMACWKDNSVYKYSNGNKSTVNKNMEDSKSINIHLNTDFRNILDGIFQQALQRIKPCFLTRLCEYSTQIVFQRNFNHALACIFFDMVAVLADKREFINIYHTTMKNRLLNNIKEKNNNYTNIYNENSKYNDGTNQAYNTSENNEKTIQGLSIPNQIKLLRKIINPTTNLTKNISVLSQSTNPCINALHMVINNTQRTLNNTNFPINTKFNTNTNLGINTKCLVNNNLNNANSDSKMNNNLNNFINDNNNFNITSNNLNVNINKKLNINFNKNRFDGSLDETIKRERKMLDGFSADDRLYEMLRDLSKNKPRRCGNNVLTLLNQTCWGTDSDNNAQAIIPDSFVKDFTRAFGGTYKNNIYKIEDRNVRIMHYHSTVTLSINSVIIVLNMYQYIVINALIYPTTYSQIKETTGMNDFILKNVLSLLIKESLVIYDNTTTLYSLNTTISPLDLSKKVYTANSPIDFAMDAYLEALIVKIIKKFKEIQINSITENIRKHAIVDVDDESIKNAINSTIKKGFIENKNNLLIYIP